MLMLFCDSAPKISLMCVFVCMCVAAAIYHIQTPAAALAQMFTAALSRCNAAMYITERDRLTGASPAERAEEDEKCLCTTVTCFFSAN